MYKQVKTKQSFSYNIWMCKTKKGYILEINSGMVFKWRNASIFAYK